MTSQIESAKKAMSDMPNPTAADLEDPIFSAIWDEMKHWDVNVPAYYAGYCGANGSHVMLILNRVRDCLRSLSGQGSGQEAILMGFSRK